MIDVLLMKLLVPPKVFRIDLSISAMCLACPRAGSGFLAPICQTTVQSDPSLNLEALDIAILPLLFFLLFRC